MSRLLEGANQAQRAAITFGDGPLLVLAGPGSGKTLVVTRRIAHLIEECGVPASQILAITFTNKAAGEMRERVQELTGRSGIWLSTFHSFAVRVLRSHAERLGLGYGTDFTILDELDQRSVVKQCLEAAGGDPTTDRPNAIGGRISTLKSKGVGPDDFDPSQFDHAGRLLRDVYRRYQTEIVRQNAMDFDDLLGNLGKLIRVDEVRDLLRNRFRYVLVDEYQDTNRIQFEIAAGLAAEHRNLCVTGDPDQSIYSWRGAEIRNILDFEKTFPEATTIRLEQNSRSTKRILALASAVIQVNEDRKDKDLWSENPEGAPVKLLACADSSDEGFAIADRVLEAFQRGTPYSDIAIFFRTNALSRAVEQGLRDRGVPYAVIGGVEFFRRKEIKHLLAYLRVRSNPRDDVALERIINVPPRRIGKRTIDRVRAFATSRGISLRDSLDRSDEIPELKGVAARAIREFAGLLARIEEVPASDVAGCLKFIYHAINYEKYVTDQDERHAQARDRKDNVAELLVAAREFDERGEEDGLAGFLEQVALVADVDDYDHNIERVSLMTLHSAKGLEFPVGFVAGLEEGLLPHSRSQLERKHLEEERRLFFVGVTRAKRELTLSYAQRRIMNGQWRDTLPSRFLEEVPPGSFEVERRGIDLFSPSPVPSFGGSGRSGGGNSFGGGSAGDEFDPCVDEDPSKVFRVGESVRHDRFGVGRVTEIRGRAGRPRVVVHFEHVGRKELLLEYAQLERMEEEGEWA
jgi:DNA helicase-2/ATP-dependent DNA helicase PcrA